MTKNYEFMKPAIKIIFYFLSIIILLFLIQVLNEQGGSLGLIGWIVLMGWIFGGYRYFVKSELSAGYKYVTYLEKYMAVANPRVIESAVNLIYKKKFIEAKSILTDKNQEGDYSIQFMLLLLSIMIDKEYSKLDQLLALEEQYILKPFGDYYALVCECYEKSSNEEKYSLYRDKLRESTTLLLGKKS